MKKINPHWAGRHGQPGPARRAPGHQRLVLGVAAAAGVLALAACGSSGSTDGSSPGSTTSSARADTVIEGVSTPAATFDPIQADNSTVDMVALQEYDTLVKIGDNGQVADSVATSVTTSADGKTISVTLRKGVTFHNGTPLTATDVKYTLDRIKKINIDVASMLTGYVSSKVIDPTHLTITLSAPYTPFISALSRMYILNSKLVQAHAGTDEGQSWLATHDAGSGPYELQSGSTTSDIKLTQYSKYWGGSSGQPKNIEMEVMTAATERSALLDGSIDIGMNIDPSDWSTFSSNSSYVVDKASTYEMLYGFMKMKNAPTSNLYLREAISYAYDYTEDVQDILKGAGKTAEGVLPSSMTCYDGHSTQPTYDAAKAKALLAKSGLKNVTLTLAYLSDENETVQAATLLQSNLAAIGITLKLEAVTYPQFVDLYKSNSTAPDIGFVYAFPADSDPSNILYQVFDSQFIGTGQNWSGYDNPTVDKLVTEAQQVSGTSQRCAIYHQAENLIDADSPTINMSNTEWVTIYNKRISGYVYEPSHAEVTDFYRLKVS